MKLLYTPGPVSSWMGDSLQAGKPSRYVTAAEIDVDSVFSLAWDGKMSVGFWAES